jgi:hypothetical protein
LIGLEGDESPAMARLCACDGSCAAIYFFDPTKVRMRRGPEALQSLEVLTAECMQTAINIWNGENDGEPV